MWERIWLGKIGSGRDSFVKGSVDVQSNIHQAQLLLEDSAQSAEQSEYSGAAMVETEAGLAAFEPAESKNSDDVGTGGHKRCMLPNDRSDAGRCCRLSRATVQKTLPPKQRRLHEFTARLCFALSDSEGQ